VNKRIAGVLLVLLAVLGGAALLYYNQERARRPANVATLGRPLLQDLKVAEVAAIRIVEPKATLTLERKEERWTIAERGGFPADFARVREFLINAIGLKVGQSEPLGEKDRARLNLDASGTLVEFLGADGKPLSRLTVGKKYFKRDVENPEKARGDGRFVAVAGDAQTVYLVADPLTQASTKSADWIDRSSFKVEKVKTLEVRYPDGEGWRIERSGDNADWKLAGARPGEKLEVTRANAASYSLGLLELADIAPKEVKEDTKISGLDKPIVIDATTLDGVSYKIRVGKLQADSHYVTFTSSGTPKGDEKDAERIKALQERLPREKLLSKYVLLIPKAKLEDTLRKRGDLLEKKEDKK
jgi:hypothetical protein